MQATKLQATKFNTITRMLLTSDGSTTLLLESILQAPLYVEVSQQVELAYDSLPAEIIRFINPAKSDLLIYRESCLKTGENLIVSCNSVWMCLKEFQHFEQDLLDKNIPLGKQLNRVHHKRKLHGYGERGHVFNSTEYLCPYKHYTIHFADNSNSIYIHETFLPSILDYSETHC